MSPRSVSYVTAETACDAVVFYVGAILRGAGTKNAISHGLVCLARNGMKDSRYSSVEARSTEVQAKVIAWNGEMERSPKISTNRKKKEG